MGIGLKARTQWRLHLITKTEGEGIMVEIEKSLPATECQAGQTHSNQSISPFFQESTHSVMLIDGFIGSIRDFQQYLKDTKPMINIYKRRLF